MNRLIYTVIALLVATVAQPQSVVCVDERLELSAIVWRLAGAEEYNTYIYPPYGKDIENYFAPYKKHPVMQFIREMRNAPDSVRVVSYNSVPVAAAITTLDRGHIRLNPDVDPVKYLARNDPRWTAENLKRYVKLLDDFYRRSSFDRFFGEHADLYAAYRTDMEEALPMEETAEWFTSMYGEAFPPSTVYVSPAFGSNNFSLSPAILSYLGRSGIGSIVGVTYDPRRLDAKAPVHILIHEISHSFTTPLFRPYQDRFIAAGQKIYAHLPRRLTAAGYGAPEPVVGEFLNELLTMMYMRDVLRDDLAENIVFCESKGFIWTGQAVRYMDNFYNNRHLFPTIREFMPQLAGFMATIADQIETIKEEYNRPPRVVYTFPACGSEVPSGLEEVVVRFSHPMSTGITASMQPRSEGIRSIQPDWDDDPANVVAQEETTEYWADDYTLVYKIGVPLEKGKNYGITVPANPIRKDNGVPLADNYEITFTIQ